MLFYMLQTYYFSKR